MNINFALIKLAAPMHSSETKNLRLSLGGPNLTQQYLMERGQMPISGTGILETGGVVLGGLAGALGADSRDIGTLAAVGGGLGGLAGHLTGRTIDAVRALRRQRADKNKK